MSTRPTSKLPNSQTEYRTPLGVVTATTQQVTKDPLPWWAGLLLLVALATFVRLAATRHPAIAQAGLIIGTAALALIWRTPFITRRLKGRLYGKGRTACTLLAVTGNGVALAGYLHVSGWWWLTLPALLVWVTTVIGAGGNAEQLRERFRMAHAVVATTDDDQAAARAVHDADRGLKVFRQMLSEKYPNAKVSAPTQTASGGLSLLANSDVPIPPATLAWIAGRAYGYPQNDILVADLSAEGRTGTYKVVIGAPPIGPARPWEMDAPDIPPDDEWPHLTFPLGWTIDGILWAPLTIHWMFAGITDSGKSNSLNVMIGAAYRWRFQLVLIDPKQTELYPWRHHAYAYGDDAATIRAALVEVERVRQLRMETRRKAGLKKWDDALGPRVLVVIDEIAEAIKIAPTIGPMIETLARLARAEGIILVIADQHPTEKSFPTIIKRNMPNVICHRVKDAGASRTALDESITKQGFDAADPTIPAGGGVASLASIGTTWVMVYEEGPMPPVRGFQAVPFSPFSSASTGAPTQGVQGQNGQNVQNSTDPEQNGNSDRNYKWDAAVEGALHHLPRSMRDIADSIGCGSTSACQSSLKRLEARGKAAYRDGGWVNPVLADLSFDPED